MIADFCYSWIRLVSIHTEYLVVLQDTHWEWAGGCLWVREPTSEEVKERRLGARGVVGWGQSVDAVEEAGGWSEIRRTATASGCDVVRAKWVSMAR